MGRVNIPLVFEVNKWYRLKLEMREAQVTLWIDDQLMAQADWRNIEILPEGGMLGLGGGGGEFHFDNFVITGDEISGLAVIPKSKLTITWGQIRAK